MELPLIPFFSDVHTKYLEYKLAVDIALYQGKVLSLTLTNEDVVEDINYQILHYLLVNFPDKAKRFLKKNKVLVETLAETSYAE